MVRTGTEPVGAALMAECDAVEGVSGEAWWVPWVYAIHGDDFDGRPSRQATPIRPGRAVVQRLSFETGYWPVLGSQQRASAMKPASTWPAWRTSRRPVLTFIAFRFPYSPAIGVSWSPRPGRTSTCRTSRITARAASAEHRCRACRTTWQILALAGQADMRILIIDADAPVLPGLSLAGE